MSFISRSTGQIVAYENLTLNETLNACILFRQTQNTRMFDIKRASFRFDSYYANT